MKQQKRVSKWEATLDAILADPHLSLRKRGLRDGHLPLIVNCVATVSLMPPGCKLPLETLATHLGPCAQYAPQQFAANIFKLGDSTGLLFSSGKLLLTAALTEMHVLYACQYFRLCIESVPYRIEPWRLAAASPARLQTTFDNLATHNVVGHGHFSFTVDLERLRAAYPDCIEYVSDGFPACRIKTWVYEDQQCHCGFSASSAAAAAIPNDAIVPAAAAKHLKRKCRCIIKCLVFANGSIVMIGGKTTAHVNYVFFHMKRLCRNPRSPFQGGLEAPLLLRLPGAHERRIEKPHEIISENTAMTLALVAAHEFKDKTKVRQVSFTNDTTLLMYLADAGRLEAVRYTLALEPDQLWQQDAKGRNVLQRLRDASPPQAAVLAYLEYAAAALCPAGGRPT